MCSKVRASAFAPKGQVCNSQSRAHTWFASLILNSQGMCGKQPVDVCLFLCLPPTFPPLLSESNGRKKSLGEDFKNAQIVQY